MLPFTVVHFGYFVVPPKGLQVTELVSSPGLLAGLTFERFRFVVYAPVMPQGLLIFELLAAYRAHIVRWFIMPSSLVSLKVCLTHKRSRTFVTLEILLNVNIGMDLLNVTP